MRVRTDKEHKTNELMIRMVMIMRRHNSRHNLDTELMKFQWRRQTGF